MQLIFTFFYFLFYHFSIIVCAHVHHYIAFFFFFFFSSRGVTARLFMSWPNLKPFVTYYFLTKEGLLSCLLSWTEISMIIALEQERFFFFLSFPEGKKKGKRITSHFFLSPTHSISPLHPTSSSLPIIPIIITTPFLLPPLPNIPIIHSCSSDFHCLFSQKNPISTLSPLKGKKKHKR